MMWICLGPPTGWHKLQLVKWWILMLLLLEMLLLDLSNKNTFQKELPIILTVSKGNL